MIHNIFHTGSCYTFYIFLIHLLYNIKFGLGESDPYVELSLNKGDKKIITTPVIKDNLNPEWNFKN